MDAGEAPSPRVPGAGRSGVVVVWMRNDLRLHDSASLTAAAAMVASGEADSVLPLFCFDPAGFGPALYCSAGACRTGALRAAFLLESVSELRASLQSIGSGLAVRVGRPRDCIPALAAELGRPVVAVCAQSEVTTEERDEEAAVREAVQRQGAVLSLVWGSTLLHIDDLPFEAGLADFPSSFTGFRRAVEEAVDVRQVHATPEPGDLPLPQGLGDSVLGPMPRLPELPFAVAGACSDAPGPGIQGGEAAGLERLQYYWWETDLVADYFNIRNNLLGRDFSTRLSAWLALGCVSPRMVHKELQRYEQERTANKSTYWITFELLTRDFYRFFALKHGRRMFRLRGLEDAYTLEWDRRPELFERWKAGRTGLPLVDACMRELNATGYMSNRGRQNAASFLIMDYGVDWRKGAEYFESRLVDYDPALNWGNWVAAAGLTGGRLNRFNVVKQSRDYDPDGAFLRQWLPELARCPTEAIHEPWLMTDAQQDEAGVRIGEDYPLPIPDEDLPCGRMQQMENIKQQRAEAKQAAAAAKREAARQRWAGTGQAPGTDAGSREGPQGPSGSKPHKHAPRGAAADKFRYHDDPKDKYKAEGVQRPRTE